MKRPSILALTVLSILTLASASAFAGGAECQQAAAEAAAKAGHAGKCSMAAAECKQMMAESRTRWIGLEYDHTEDGAVTVVRVFPDSPAEEAGFRAGDELVALNGVAMVADNHEKLMALRKSQQAGQKVTYTVRRDGAERSLEVKLGRMPDQVYESVVAEHMKEHEDGHSTH